MDERSLQLRVGVFVLLAMMILPVERPRSDNSSEMTISFWKVFSIPFAIPSTNSEPVLATISPLLLTVSFVFRLAQSQEATPRTIIKNSSCFIWYCFICFSLNQLVGLILSCLRSVLYLQFFCSIPE